MPMALKKDHLQSLKIVDPFWSSGLDFHSLQPIVNLLVYTKYALHPTTQKWPKVVVFHNLLKAKTSCYKKKPVKSWNKTFDPSFGANLF